MVTSEIANLAERAQLNPDAVRAFGYLGLSLVLLTAGLGVGGSLIAVKDAHPLILPLLNGTGWGIKYTGEIGFGASALIASWHAWIGSYHPTK